MDHKENKPPYPSKGFNGFQNKENKGFGSVSVTKKTNNGNWYPKAKRNKKNKNIVKKPVVQMHYEYGGWEIAEQREAEEAKITLMDRIRMEQSKYNPMRCQKVIVAENNLFDQLPVDDTAFKSDEETDVYLRKKAISVPWNKLSLCFERQPWDSNNPLSQKNTHKLQNKYSTNTWDRHNKGQFVPPRGSGVLLTPFYSSFESDMNASRHSFRQNITSGGRRSMPNHSQVLNKSNMTIHSDEETVCPREDTFYQRENTVVNISRVSNPRNKSNTTAHSVDRYDITTSEKKTNVTNQSQGLNKSNMTVYSFDISDVTGDNNPMNLTNRSCGRNRSNATIHSHDDSPSVTQSNGCNGSNPNRNQVVDVFGEIARKDGGMRLANQLRNIRILNSTREDLDRSAYH